MFVKETKNKTIPIRVTEKQKENLEELAKKRGYKNVSDMTLRLWEQEFKKMDD